MNICKRIINLKNGVFDIRDMIFSSHNPKYFSAIQIPVEYKVAIFGGEKITSEC
jgi:phage/plasmid-associated DNA primase